MWCDVKSKAGAIQLIIIDSFRTSLLAKQRTSDFLYNTIVLNVWSCILKWVPFLFISTQWHVYEVIISICVHDTMTTNQYTANHQPLMLILKMKSFVLNTTFEHDDNVVVCTEIKCDKNPLAPVYLWIYSQWRGQGAYRSCVWRQWSGDKPCSPC